jgi:hypothetical protein
MAYVHTKQPRQPVQEPLSVVVIDIAPLSTYDHGELGALPGSSTGEVRHEVRTGQVTEIFFRHHFHLERSFILPIVNHMWLPYKSQIWTIFRYQLRAAKESQ